MKDLHRAGSLPGQGVQGQMTEYDTAGLRYIAALKLELSRGQVSTSVVACGQNV